MSRSIALSIISQGIAEARGALGYLDAVLSKCYADSSVWNILVWARISMVRLLISSSDGSGCITICLAALASMRGWLSGVCAHTYCGSEVVAIVDAAARNSRWAR